MPYVGGTVALLSLVLSMLTYIFVTARNLVKEVRKDEIKIVYFSNEGESVFLNTGPREVYLLRVEIDASVVSTQLLIDEPVAPNKFLSHEFTIFLPESSDAHPLANVDDETWDELMSGERCNVALIYNKENPTLQKLKNIYGKRLRTFDADGRVVFYSVKERKEISQLFSCEGYFVDETREDGQCKP